MSRLDALKVEINHSEDFATFRDYENFDATQAAQKGTMKERPSPLDLHATPN